MTLRSIWRPMKDEVVAEHGAVASARSSTSEVGVEVLRQGGNAVDAAVAMGFCLTVVEPMSSCIAGHGQMLVYMADQGGKATALDFSHRAPKAATSDMYKVLRQVETGNGFYQVEGNANAWGYQAAGVPGVAAGLCKAHELWGTLPLEQLLEPAVHYAEEGFLADWPTRLHIANAMAEFIKYEGSHGVFLPNGCPPRSQLDRLVQRDLGQTLRRIAREGRSGLYEGEIPHAIEEDMKKNGGLLRVEDFAEFEVLVAEPARIRYRGYDVLGIPVPSGCTTMLQTLNILDNFDLGSLDHNSTEYLHLFIETARHAFADRYRYLGDPEYVPVPLKGMLSREYAEEVAGAIARESAALEGERERQPWLRFAEEVLHDPWQYDDRPNPGDELRASPPSDGDCTTHFGVIDNDRNMVACTQTAVGSFGSRVITPGTGVLFSNGMVTFNPMPGAANSIAGGKQCLANMVPTLVLRDGKPFLNVGAPGGRKIMNCITQIVLNVIDHKMGIQDAIGVPRVDAADRETYVDSRIHDATVEALRRMGHNVEVVEMDAAHAGFLTGFARPSGLMVDPESNRVHAGAEVFNLTEARGY